MLVPVPGVVLILNSRAYKVFLSSFFLESKRHLMFSVAVRSSLARNFESNLVMVSFRDMMSYVVKPFLSERTCFSTFFNNKSKSCG